ncbi:MAG: UDP-3-O-(3-hydroxymyristoyl)glucosamine N-acyltransferase [Bdellovibrio sp.]
MILSISIQTILKANPHALHLVRGEMTVSVSKIQTPENADADSLVFISEDKKFSSILKSPPGILILDRRLEALVPQLPPNVPLVLASDFKLSIARILKLFSPRTSPQLGIHPSAQISPSAKIDPSCCIGPYVVVEDGAEIGARTRIDSHCVIEFGARIGTDCRLHSHVSVGSRCEIGNFCELFAHSGLGSDGFGFIPQPPHAPEKVPQIGRVRLEDYVEIGAATQIDRATIGETLIRKGTKIDNLCHIAHNCEIGENSLIAAGFMTAGSVKIGNRFMCGGDVVCSDHIAICDDVLIGGRSAVTSSINAPGRYTGYPLLPWREGLKALSSVATLPELRKRIQELENRLNLLAGS